MSFGIKNYMLVSLNWLKKYVSLPPEITPQDLGLRLTLSTVEVEGVENQVGNLDNIVVGKILSIEDHPHADKLKLVEVDIKTEKLKVVCGGINLKEGMLVAVAKVGAKVRWHGEGEIVTLKRAKIRGIESSGMICAAEEIGLGEFYPSKQAGEILDLTVGNYSVGQNLAEALELDDQIIEIDNKSITNRPDLWGHYGLARELAAIYKTKLEPYSPSKIKDNKEVNLTVKIDKPEWCLRYLGIIIDGIEVAESPAWLKKSLQAVGLKSINNIVDVTNYLLFDLGQPMHAFDANLIYNYEIHVRAAKKNEKIITLDGVERELNENNLVIADAKKPVAIAGVMGGKNSEITDKTKTIIIESATFDPYNIRKTSIQLGLRTEASIRYEKSLDPEMAKLAMERAVELILQLCPKARVISNLVDEYPSPKPEIIIDTTYDFINRKIGQEISKDFINETLERLGFILKKKNDSLKITVPSWRATKDISIPEDLVEEIARLYGYDNLKPQMPTVDIDLVPSNQLRDLERECKNLLVNAAGLTEVSNYVFTGEAELKKFGFNVNDYIKLVNPLDVQFNLLRQSLLPGLLNNVVTNQPYFDEIALFEAGRVFLNKPGTDLISPAKKDFLPDQPLIFAGVYYSKDNHEPFYNAKAQVELLLKKLNIKYLETLVNEPPSFCHPQRAWQAEINGEFFVQAGELHPALLAKYDFPGQVAFWQINFDKLNAAYVRQYLYAPPSKYPEIKMDLAIIVNEKTLWKDIKTLVKNVAPQIITKIELFDLYRNDIMKAAGKKSLAFHVCYQSAERTLEMKEVQKIQDKVIEQLKKAMKAEIRK